MANAPGHGPHNFEIETARITADRASGRKMDIAEAIVEITFFEHLNHPYMTGRMVLVDNVDIYGLADFQGTEKFEFSATYSKGNDGPPGTFRKRFVITSIERTQKSNDNVEVLVFSLTEEHMFRNAIEVISKAYTGKPNEIISKLVQDANLGVTVKNKGLVEIQDNMRYLVPYITPLEATKVVKEGATTPEGYPYFLYSTFGDENELHYRSLSTLLEETPIAGKNDPFRYTIYSTGLADAELRMDKNDPRNPNGEAKYNTVDIEERSRFIEKYQQINQQNLISLMLQGHVGSTNEFVNINQYNFHTHKHDLEKEYGRLKSKLPSDQQRDGYDQDAFGGIHNKNNRYITRVYASHLYSDSLNNLYDTGVTLGSYLSLKSMSEGVRALMEKQAINIELPGYHFWPNGSSENGRTIGRKIPLQFLNNDLEGADRDSRRVIDQQRSGEYLIYAASHNFSLRKYSVGLTCVKFSSLNVTV